MTLVKAHALGNDFLLIDERELSPSMREPAVAQAVCERHRGIGADGLIVFREDRVGAAMRLWNADGSPSEISGNGVRCLAAWLAERRALPVGGRLTIGTGAGPKDLDLLDRCGPRLTFRAAMGAPADLTRRALQVGDELVEVVTMTVGNPQCVVIGELSEARLSGVAARLAVHPAFPEGTNVELASVEGADRVRILIWERGVGPTEASGTGACASAVAAAAYGGAARDVEVVAPGGAQRVEWREDGLYLTGWAEIVAEIRWLA